MRFHHSLVLLLPAAILLLAPPASTAPLPGPYDSYWAKAKRVSAEVEFYRNEAQSHLQHGRLPAAIKLYAIAMHAGNKRTRPLLFAEMQPLLVALDTHSLLQIAPELAPGWVELTAILRSLPLPTRQRQALYDWVQQWPRHPARASVQQLHAELNLMVDLRPQHLLVALPLQTPLLPVSQMILDGLFSAHFYSEASERHISVIDSSALSFEQIYSQAILHGANAIIGPLRKQSAQQAVDFLSGTNHHLPVLSLNYTPEEPGHQLYQFGLAPEADIRAIAALLSVRRLQRVLLIHTRTPWADRMVEALRRHYSGAIITTEPVDAKTNLSQTLSDVLGVTASTKRKEQLDSLLDVRRIEFTPRRRQDLDAVVLVAEPATLLAVKPLLAFYFAADLPFFVSSHGWSRDAKNLNEDRNNILLTMLPWDIDQPLREQLLPRNLWHDAQYQSPFFALGVDAYLLSSYLQPGMRRVLRGTTGLLSLEGNRVRRQPVWARSRNNSLDAAAIPAYSIYSGYWPEDGTTGPAAPATTGAETAEPQLLPALR